MLAAPAAAHHPRENKHEAVDGESRVEVPQKPCVAGRARAAAHKQHGRGYH